MLGHLARQGTTLSTERLVWNPGALPYSRLGIRVGFSIRQTLDSAPALLNANSFGMVFGVVTKIQSCRLCTWHMNSLRGPIIPWTP